MDSDVTLHLHDTGVPPGQISLDPLARTAAALQELVTRVGRLAGG